MGHSLGVDSTSNVSAQRHSLGVEKLKTIAPLEPGEQRELAEKAGLNYQGPESWHVNCNPPLTIFQFDLQFLQ